MRRVLLVAKWVGRFAVSGHLTPAILGALVLAPSGLRFYAMLHGFVFCYGCGSRWGGWS
jgi:uncharacterized membrane protein